MKGKFLSRTVAYSLILIFLMNIFSGLTVRVYADSAAASANRMNVVFVMDESGSMNTTDREKFRYEAVKMFFGISAERGDYVGAVVFNDGIVLKEDLALINGKEDKQALAQKLENVVSNGDTDIGEAVNTAADMILEKGNPDLDNVIIVLSDGNTDLSEVIKDENELSRAMAQSESDKQSAIDKAVAGNIKIHTVCLNSNGAADKSELQNISDKTGGTCVEVTKAEDLKTVFATFYELIYSIETIKLTDSEIGSDSVLSVPFEIPQTGIDEANIIVNMDSKLTAALTDPNGNLLDDAAISQMSMSGRTFNIIKLNSPVAGQWQLDLAGKAGSHVAVDMIYNSDLEVELSSSATEDIKTGDSVSINCVVKDKGKEVTSLSNPAKLVIRNITSGQEEEYSMQPGESGYEYTFVATDIADYELMATVELDGLKKSSDTVRISIGNTSPEAEDFSVTKFIMPVGNKAVFDLSEHASDAEDEELTYSIAGGSIDSSALSLEGSKLTVDYAASGAGTIELLVTDSRGLSQAFTLTLSCVNITLIVGIVLGIIILAAVIIFVVKFILMNGPKAIKGKVVMIPFVDGEAGEAVEFDQVEPKKMIGEYMHVYEDIGVDLSKAYLNGSMNSSHIFFITTTAKGYRTKFNPFAERTKIRLDDKRETFIYGRSGISCGICITYRSSKGAD